MHCFDYSGTAAFFWQLIYFPFHIRNKQLATKHFTHYFTNKPSICRSFSIKTVPVVKRLKVLVGFLLKKCTVETNPKWPSKILTNSRTVIVSRTFLVDHVRAIESTTQKIWGADGCHPAHVWLSFASMVFRVRPICPTRLLAFIRTRLKWFRCKTRSAHVDRLALLTIWFNRYDTPHSRHKVKWRSATNERPRHRSGCFI